MLEVVVCPDGSPLGRPVRPASGQYPQYRGAYGRFLAADDTKVEYAVFHNLDSTPSFESGFQEKAGERRAGLSSSGTSGKEYNIPTTG
jgi:hypothetical protein